MSVFAQLQLVNSVEFSSQTYRASKIAESGSQKTRVDVDAARRFILHYAGKPKNFSEKTTKQIQQTDQHITQQKKPQKKNSTENNEKIVRRSLRLLLFKGKKNGL